MARSVTLRRLVIIFLASALAAGLLSCRRQPPAAPSPEAKAVLESWLASNCSVRDQRPIESGLRKFGAELETPLIDLFNNGPAEADVNRVEGEARLQFENTRALLRSGASTGLPPNDAEALLNVSVDEWVKRAGQDFVESQRTAALAGLGIIAGVKGRKLLEQIASDPNSPYNEAARPAADDDPPDAQK